METFDHQYTEYQTRRSALRKLVRKAYLHSARSKLRGATLDFGCGVGELLAGLPAGSKGLEYNRATVDHCRARGLDVDWYDGFADDWSLTVLPDGETFESMVVSHVLEHLDHPDEVLNRLLSAAASRAVQRVLVIVPGHAGFRIDDTHRTFVDSAMLGGDAVVQRTPFRLASSGYFPGNLRVIGDVFAHHELQALYVRQVGG